MQLKFQSSHPNLITKSIETQVIQAFHVTSKLM